MVHAGYVGNVFCYLFDRKEKGLWEQERIAPLSAGIRIDRKLFAGVSSYHTEHERVRVEARNGMRLLDIRLKDKNQEQPKMVLILMKFIMTTKQYLLKSQKKQRVKRNKMN